MLYSMVYPHSILAISVCLSNSTVVFAYKGLCLLLNVSSVFIIIIGTEKVLRKNM